MRTQSTKLKKISSLMTVCAILATLSPLSVHAVSGGSFVAAQTQAATTGGLDNTQSITLATTQANKRETAAIATMGSIIVTSDILGTAGNNITINVSGTGNLPPARTDAEIVITKGSGIFVEIRNTPTVTITQSELAEALNMSANGTIRGGLIKVDIQNNVSGDITASGGNSSAITDMNGVLDGGTMAQTQIDTLTIGGTVEIGDVFSVNLPQGPIYFTATNTDIGATANGLNTAIQSVPAYNIQNYTTSVSGGVITVTARTAGDGFNVGAVTATNASGVSQMVTFTPTNPQVGETFRATINGTDYNHTVTASQTAADIVNTLSPLMDARADVTCSENDAVITCTTVSGALSSYSATVFTPSADTTAPVITEITPIATPSTLTTPQYTFTTTEAGTIHFGKGSCSSTTTTAVVGSNTITLDTLAVGTYTDCSLTVTDSASNTSNTLTIPSFTITAVTSGGGGGGGGGGGSSRSSSRTITTTADETDELICRGPTETGTWYKKCSLTTSPETFNDFATNAACEGFIGAKESEEGYEMTKTAPRKEVVAVAVSMLKKDGKPIDRISSDNYKNHFTDIGINGQDTWIQSVVETALANNIITDARDTFQPENSVTRAEAYAMIMASVCMKPESSGTTWQENIYTAAESAGLTTRTWATFESESAIMRQDLFVVASRAADWAEKTGGCNPKPAECIAE